MVSCFFNIFYASTEIPVKNYGNNEKDEKEQCFEEQMTKEGEGITKL